MTYYQSLVLGEETVMIAFTTNENGAVDEAHVHNDLDTLEGEGPTIEGLDIDPVKLTHDQHIILQECADGWDWE